MPNADAIVLDTHVLLWWQAGSKRLSATARAAIERATSVGVSAISAFEIALLVDKGRVILDRPVDRWMTDLFATDGIEELALAARVATAAGPLNDFHGDPADRMIYATARGGGRPLVTKDARITSYARRTGEVTVVW